jgi:predicted DNA-binding ArsR family transcriptional regulator
MLLNYEYKEDNLMIGKILLLKNGLMVVPIFKIINSDTYNCIIVKGNGNSTHEAVGNVVGAVIETPIFPNKEIEGLVMGSDIFWLNKKKKHIKIKSCGQCPYMQLSKRHGNEISNQICQGIEKKEYDYKSDYDDIQGKFIISLKGISKVEFAEYLDSHIPDWCPLEDAK